MIVVDSCGWLESITGSGLAELYEPALSRPDEMLVPAVCLLEVARVMERERGHQAAVDCLAIMCLAVVIPLDGALAATAARIGHELRLPCADSVIYATAQAHDAELWTHDPHFRDLPGVRFIEAPAG